MRKNRLRPRQTSRAAIKRKTRNNKLYDFRRGGYYPPFRVFITLSKNLSFMYGNIDLLKDI
jgi:hypothetical protein